MSDSDSGCGWGCYLLSSTSLWTKTRLPCYDGDGVEGSAVQVVCPLSSIREISTSTHDLVSAVLWGHCSVSLPRRTLIHAGLNNWKLNLFYLKCFYHTFFSVCFTTTNRTCYLKLTYKQLQTTNMAKPNQIVHVSCFLMRESCACVLFVEMCCAYKLVSSPVFKLSDS